MLSLNHPSAFLDRRRYYETYVRYVVFSRFGTSCMSQQQKGDFIFYLYLFHVDLVLDR